MKISEIKIGESYRHKDHINYCWAKVLKILKPKQEENTTTKTLVKCSYSQTKDGDVAIIKYFKPSNLTK